MSLEKTLHEKAEEQKSRSQYVSLKDVGDNIPLKLQSWSEKKDNRGKLCIFMVLENEEAKLIVQKFTPTAYDDLAEAIKTSGGEAKLKSEFHVYMKHKSGRAMFDRLFPTPEVIKPVKPKQ